MFELIFWQKVQNKSCPTFIKWLTASQERYLAVLYIHEAHSDGSYLKYVHLIFHEAEAENVKQRQEILSLH